MTTQKTNWQNGQKVYDADLNAIATQVNANTTQVNANAAAIAALGSGTSYNVKDHGVVGNGTADDTAAIQAAIDAVSAAGGGQVFLPIGTYKLTTKLTLKSGVELAGTGSMSVLKPNFPTSSPNRIIDNDWIAGSTDITLRDFKLDRSTALLGHGMIFNGVDGLLIDGIEVTGGPPTASGAGTLAISGIGPTTRLLSKNIRIVNCQFNDTGNYGIQAGYVDGCVIANNTAQNAYREVFATEPEVGTTATNVVIANNTINGSTTANGTATGLIIATENSGGTIRGCSIHGNTVTQPVGGNTSQAGITVSGGDGVSVTGNTVRTVDGAGIRLGITGYNVTNGAVVQGNTVIDAGRGSGGTSPGIQLQNATRCVIMGNYVYGTSHTASVSEGASTSDNFIALNYLRDTVPLTAPAAGTATFGNKTADGDQALRVGANAMGSPRLLVNGNATGGVRRLGFQTAGVDRWNIDAQTGETGANAGSDLLFNARDDAGAGLGTALTLIRSRRGAAFGGSLGVFRRAVTANYSVVASDCVVAVTDTTAARTVTLPSAATFLAGGLLIVKDESGAAATNKITVTRAGTDLIDGAASVQVGTNYGVLRLYCTGTGWAVV